MFSGGRERVHWEQMSLAQQCNIQGVMNPFCASDLSIYLLKTSENLETIERDQWHEIGLNLNY